jgi:hypothetical protein
MDFSQITKDVQMPTLLFTSLIDKSQKPLNDSCSHLENENDGSTPHCSESLRL